jgi:hypothetical protein
MVNKKADMQIQQMAFMIIAVFIFFGLVGLFFINIQVSKIGSNAASLQRDQAISSIQVIADMPELSFSAVETMTLDEDKIRIMSGEFGKDYELLWPVAYVGVRKIYPKPERPIKCPAENCNYYEIYNSSEQESYEIQSTFVSICSKRKEGKSIYNKCEIGKLDVGVNIYE